MSLQENIKKKIFVPPMDILKLRWIARFALKEGHSCRICHCVHFIVQFASALPSQPPLHLSPVPLPLLTCVVDLYSAISSDVLHDIFYTNVLTRFGDYVLRNNHLNVQLYYIHCMYVQKGLCSLHGWLTLSGFKG